MLWKFEFNCKKNHDLEKTQVRLFEVRRRHKPYWKEYEYMQSSSPRFFLFLPQT